jgi:hypothetical protein
MRYFFDYTTADRSLYDFRGDDFQSSRDAIEFAQATAEVLKHSLSEDWTGWSVVVRCCQGKNLFSLPVKSSGEPIAA